MSCNFLWLIEIGIAYYQESKYKANFRVFCFQTKDQNPINQKYSGLNTEIVWQNKELNDLVIYLIFAEPPDK
jgi:hypothetical protein